MPSGAATRCDKKIIYRLSDDSAHRAINYHIHIQQRQFHADVSWGRYDLWQRDECLRCGLFTRNDYSIVITLMYLIAIKKNNVFCHFQAISHKYTLSCLKDYISQYSPNFQLKLSRNITKDWRIKSINKQNANNILLNSVE